MFIKNSFFKERVERAIINQKIFEECFLTPILSEFPISQIQILLAKPYTFIATYINNKILKIFIFIK